MRCQIFNTNESAGDSMDKVVEAVKTSAFTNCLFRRGFMRCGGRLVSFICRDYESSSLIARLQLAEFVGLEYRHNLRTDIEYAHI